MPCPAKWLRTSNAMALSVRISFMPMSQPKKWAIGRWESPDSLINRQPNLANHAPRFNAWLSSSSNIVPLWYESKYPHVAGVGYWKLTAGLLENENRKK